MIRNDKIQDKANGNEFRVNSIDNNFSNIVISDLFDEIDLSYFDDDMFYLD